MAEQVGRLFCNLLEGLSEEEEGHYRCPVPPSSDDAFVATAANDDVGGNQG